MKKIIFNLLFVIYVVVAVFVTVCLLSYNQFKVTEFGAKSLIIVSDNTLEPTYKKGDLVIADKKETITSGNKAFFYNTYNQKIEVALGTVTDVERVTNTEKTYTLDGDRRISSEYVLGTTKNAQVISGVGAVLGVLESRWGFLFIIVLPSLLAFLYQISVVVSDIRGLKENKGNIENNEEQKA